MRTYLVKFDYDYYCQGYERGTETFLVYADTFEEACRRILNGGKFLNVRNFRNLTLD